MNTYRCEYIWLDSYKPEANLRSKTKVIVSVNEPSLENSPLWSYDGSSTMQAEESSSDYVLKPVKVYKDAGRYNGYLVMCEVLNPYGTAHPSNHKSGYNDDADFWFGFEQEFVILKDGLPSGLPKEGYPAPGVSDRGASTRIPITTFENGWKGYLKDRRPASNACPYLVTANVNTVTSQEHILV